VEDELKVLLDLLAGAAQNFGRLGLSARGLHAIEDGGAGDGELVEVVLEVFIAGEAEALDDAHDGGWAGGEASGHVADVEENELAGAFEDGADDLLAFFAEVS